MCLATTGCMRLRRRVVIEKCSTGVPLTSPRLRREVGLRSNPGEGVPVSPPSALVEGAPHPNPLPARAGRGSAPPLSYRYAAFACTVLQNSASRSANRNVAFLAGCTFEQREIEFAALEFALQVGALVGAHVEPQRRMRARESREQFCQAIGGKILGYSEPHRAFTSRPRHHVARFFRK